VPSVFRFRFCHAKLYEALLQHEKDFMHTYMHMSYNIHTKRLKTMCTHTVTWDSNTVNTKCIYNCSMTYFTIYAIFRSFHFIHFSLTSQYCIILFRCRFGVSVVKFTTEVSKRNVRVPIQIIFML